MVSVYLATPLTGRTGKEVWEEAIRVKQIYERHGIKAISPIDGEGIPFNDTIIGDRSNEEMHYIWKKKDKAQIRHCSVFVFAASRRASQGVLREYCLARGTLFKPTVGVYVEVSPGFIAKAEDDYTATSHEEAAVVIQARWGTWWKRFKWRLKVLNRSIPGWVGFQVKELFR